MKLAVLLAVAFLLSGCFNMPTPPSQIAGSYTSDLRYKDTTCENLVIELNSLARRESDLSIAQEQRIKASNVQAFWLGFGSGDGIEAAELAHVRGDKEAVRKAMELKHCDKPS